MSQLRFELRILWLQFYSITSRPARSAVPSSIAHLIETTGWATEEITTWCKFLFNQGFSSCPNFIPTISGGANYFTVTKTDLCEKETLKCTKWLHYVLCNWCSNYCIVSTYDIRNENGAAMKRLIKVTPNIRNIILFQLGSSTQGMSFFILSEIMACKKKLTLN